VIQSWRKSIEEQPYNLYYGTDYWGIKGWRVVWVCLVAHLKAMRNAHKTVGKQKNGVRIQIVSKGIDGIQVYMTTLWIRV